jgi:hypothetical protein
MSGLGFSSIVWIEALFKRIIDGVSGKGGIEAFCQFFDQIDFIPQLAPLRQRMKTNSIYARALAKCNKEMLKRPLQIRENEIVEFMGAICPVCQKETSLWIMSKQHGRCVCGGTLEVTYVKDAKMLFERCIMITPEIVMMNRAYDKIADAYVDAYKGFQLIMFKTAQVFNWGKFRLDDPQLRNYLDNYFLGLLTGEQQIPREEKQVLQFTIRGNLAGIEVKKAERLIRLGTQVVKYGYLYEVLGANGTYTYYQKHMQSYNKLYDRANKVIRETLAAEGLEPKHTTVQVAKSLGGSYVILWKRM